MSNRDDAIKIIRKEAVSHLIDQLKSENFYGEICVKFRNGEVSHIELKQSFVDEKQIYKRTEE